MLNRLMIRIGHVFFKVRDVVFPIVFVLLALLDKPRYPGGEEKYDLIVDIVGIAIALSGQILRGAVIGLAYIKRGGKDKKVYADTLVTEGLFAHARNPLYTGNLLTLLGLIVITNSILMWAVGAPFFLFAYLCITKAEEEYLQNKFGEQYVDYCKRVNRYIPSPRGLGATLRSMSFDWAKVVRKDYGTAFTWMTTAIGLIFWERIANKGYDAARNDLYILLPIWGVVGLGWIIARVLKKTGKLGTG